MHGLSLLFLQVVVIVALGRVVGLVMARLRQPQVLGEMVAGILLGPSLLGWLWPAGYAELFPASSLAFLELLSQLGVVFFLFLVGLELDPRRVRSQGRAAVAIANASVFVPFVLGVGATFFLYPRLLAADVPRERFTAVALFMGAAMSVTAFPVLARILTERNLHRSPIGGLAITCAAFADATAWCMLAIVVAVGSVRSAGGAAWTVAFTALYVLAMFFVVRPFLQRLEVVYDRQGRLSQPVVSIIFMLVLVSAYATHAIGVHALFGAFLMGCVMPKGTQFVRHLSEKLEDFVVVLLLPIFFAFAGLQTNVGLIQSGAMWGYTALIVAVATLGKFGGSALAARLTGLGWRDASAVGVLLNTRGLMELVILTAGLQLGLINQTVFTMMTIMALATTAMTTPLLNGFYPRRPVPTQDSGPSTQDSVYSVLIPVSLPKSGAPLVQLADAIIGPEKDRARLLALHLRKPTDHEAYRSGLDEAAQTHDESLAPLLAQARGRSMRVEAASFVSRDVSADIADYARQHRADLVLMGFHKPVIGKQILGGTVHRVLHQCPADVAVLVDRGFHAIRRVLVPYLGSAHDRLALQLAARMAKHTEAQVTVLHVVPPMRSKDGKPIGAREAVDRVFHEPDTKIPVTFRVIEDPSPVAVVLHQAQTADLVIVGVSQEWGLESQLFGWRAQRIARDCPTSLLIVKKGEGEKGRQTIPHPISSVQPST